MLDTELVKPVKGQKEAEAVSDTVFVSVLSIKQDTNAVQRLSLRNCRQTEILPEEGLTQSQGLNCFHSRILKVLWCKSDKRLIVL